VTEDTAVTDNESDSEAYLTAVQDDDSELLPITEVDELESDQTLPEEPELQESESESEATLEDFADDDAYAIDSPIERPASLMPELPEGWTNTLRVKKCTN